MIQICMTKLHTMHFYGFEKIIVSNYVNMRNSLLDKLFSKALPINTKEKNWECIVTCTFNHPSVVFFQR